MTRREQAQQAHRNARDIMERAELQERQLTPSEEQIVDDFLEEAEQLLAGENRRSRPGPVGHRYPSERAGAIFNHFGTYLQAVHKAGADQTGAVEQAKYAQQIRAAAPTTYGSEGVGADGGFAVPPEFRAGILQKIMGEESLLALCDQSESNWNSVTWPKDETTPWGGSGIQAFWDGEAATLTQSKPQLESVTHKLSKVTCLVPVTDDLLEDAPALAAYVTKKAGEVIDFKCTDAIINGTGAGMPLGILNSPATISQAAEASQVAATIHGLNIINMWARMPGQWRRNAVWLTHPDVEPWLMRAGLQIGPADAGAKTGGQLVFMPAGSLSTTPFATLLGRPIIPTQACKAVGTPGDVIFASLKQYAAVMKPGGLRSDVSMHLYFDSDVTAFRFILRIAGAPYWSAPITNKSGGNTQSAFVTLAAR